MGRTKPISKLLWLALLSHSTACVHTDRWAAVFCLISKLLIILFYWWLQPSDGINKAHVLCEVWEIGRSVLSEILLSNMQSPSSYSDARFQLQQVVVTASTCLNAPSCCSVIGWFDICAVCWVYLIKWLVSACLSSVDTVAIISFVFIFVRNCVSARSLAATPTLSPALTQFPCMAERSYLRTLWSVSKHVHFLKKQAVLRTHKLIQKMLKRRKTTEQEARESD